ncbi:MAG: hypothetical protein KDD52_04535 [Bdellovibrionales bacterium]|nr:hypothetical protein [Bdellovibrionales bacterium]
MKNSNESEATNLSKALTSQVTEETREIAIGEGKFLADDVTERDPVYRGSFFWTGLFLWLGVALFFLWFVFLRLDFLSPSFISVNFPSL